MNELRLESSLRLEQYAKNLLFSSNGIVLGEWGNNCWRKPAVVVLGELENNCWRMPAVVVLGELENDCWRKPAVVVLGSWRTTAGASQQLLFWGSGGTTAGASNSIAIPCLFMLSPTKTQAAGGLNKWSHNKNKTDDAVTLPSTGTSKCFFSCNNHYSNTTKLLTPSCY